VEKCNLAQYSATGAPRNPTVPPNMWWGYVSFKGAVRVPQFFCGNDFLLQYVDGSLWKILDPHAAFRFQVGQLVESRKRNIGSCCVACSLLCNKGEPYCCITVIRCCRCAVHNRDGRHPRIFAVYSKYNLGNSVPNVVLMLGFSSQLLLVVLPVRGVFRN